MGDKPANRRHNNLLSWDRIPFATAPLLTTQDIASQRNTVCCWLFRILFLLLTVASCSFSKSGMKMVSRLTLKMTWTNRLVITAFIIIIFSSSPCRIVFLITAHLMDYLPTCCDDTTLNTLERKYINRIVFSISIRLLRRTTFLVSAPCGSWYIDHTSEPHSMNDVSAKESSYASRLVIPALCLKWISQSYRQYEHTNVNANEWTITSRRSSQVASFL